MRRSMQGADIFTSDLENVRRQSQPKSKLDLQCKGRSALDVLIARIERVRAILEEDLGGGHGGGGREIEEKEEAPTRIG